jgi:hypothetical protein
METFVTMAKRLGHPMNEMKKKKRSEKPVAETDLVSDSDLVPETDPDIRFKHRSEIKQRLDVDKSEERKKRMESVLNIDKRVGRPMNEMKKKKKRVLAEASAADISRLEAELDQALDVLDEAMAEAGQEGSIRRRRRKRIVPENEKQVEQMEQELVKLRFFINIFLPSNFI